MVYYEKSNQTISVPPEHAGQGTWSHEAPQGLKDEVLKVMKHMYGTEMGRLEVESYRMCMCWDAVTPNQDWTISPHPSCKNLYVVAGGSFHSWKFLPTIGAYVVQKLQGTLDQEKARRWAWDRASDSAACVMYHIPTRDLKNISGYAEMTSH